MLGRKSVNQEVKVRARVLRAGVESRSGRAVAKRRPLGVGLALALAASLIVGIGVPSASAQTGSAPSVRIWARKLASANLQFGMSVSLAGTTNNVSLTNSYFLYGRNEVDTWYSSEWSVVGSSRVGVTGPGSVNTVARVRARKLASGNVEFGLEFRGLGAADMNEREVWAPRARYFLYQTTSENVSLYSSAFDVSSQAHECLNGRVFSNPQDNLGLADDCATLLASKDILTTSTLLLGSWNTDIPMFGRDFVDGWRGVHKEPEYDRVETLTSYNLPPGHAFDGSLPSYLGALAGLKYLEFDSPRNNLSGSIPTELGNLTNLVRLKLYGNSLSGNIPKELGELTSLELLILENNSLSGSIPAELGKLTNLENLYLSDNNLSGSIPAELGNLTNLKHLYLRSNNLNGSIPPEMGKLSSIEEFNVGENNLSGGIPPELGALSTTLQSIKFYSSIRRLTGNPDSDDNSGLSGCVPKSLDGTNSNGRTITVHRGNLPFCS